MKRILPFNEFEALDRIQADLSRIPVFEYSDPIEGIIANEIADEIESRVTSLDEALSSGYLRTILNGMPSYGKKSSDADFAKALYRSYKIALNDVQDSDFIHHGDPSIAFSKGANPDSLFFMMCDRQQTIDGLNRNVGKIPNPFVVAVIQAGKGLLVTKATDPKITSLPRVGYRGSSQKSSDRYGWLSDDGNAAVGYSFTSIQGRDNGISVSRSNILALATFALELNVQAFINRQGTVEDIRKQRYEQKQGVLVWKPGDKKELQQLRQANADRRKAMLGARVSVEDLFSIYSEANTIATNAINKFFHGGNIPKDPAEAARSIGISSSSWSHMPDFIDNGLRDISSAMTNMLSSLRDAMRFCYSYYDKSQRIDNLTNCLEAGKVPDENEMPSEIDLDETSAKRLKNRIDFYASSMTESLKDLVTYKSYMARYLNEVNKAVASSGI